MYFTKPAKEILNLLATLKDGPYERPVKALVAAALMGASDQLNLEDTASQAKPVFIECHDENLRELTQDYIEKIILLNLPKTLIPEVITWAIMHIKHRNHFYFYNRPEKLFVKLNSKEFSQRDFDQNNKFDFYGQDIGAEHNSVKINQTMDARQIISLASITPAATKTAYSTPFLAIRQALYWQINQLVNGNTQKHQLDRCALLCYLVGAKPRFLSLQSLIVLNFNADRNKNQLVNKLLTLNNFPGAAHALEIIEQQEKTIKQQSDLTILSHFSAERLKGLLMFCQALSPETFYRNKAKLFLENPKLFVEAIAEFSILIMVTLFGLTEPQYNRRFVDLLKQNAHQLSPSAWADLLTFYPQFIDLIEPKSLLWLKNQNNISWISFMLEQIKQTDEREATISAIYQVLSCLLFHKGKLRDWVNADVIMQLSQQETRIPYGIEILSSSPPFVLLAKFCPELIYKILAQRPELAQTIPAHFFYCGWESLSGDSIFAEFIMQFFDPALNRTKNPIFFLLANNESLRKQISYSALFEPCTYLIADQKYLSYTAFAVLLVAKNMTGLDAIIDLLNNAAICSALEANDLLCEQTHPDNYNEIFTIYDYLHVDELRRIDSDEDDNSDEKKIATLRNQKKQQILALLKKQRPDLLLACRSELSTNERLSIST